MDKPFAITLDIGSSLANKTGAWRTNRPVYLDRLPPCNHACPAGENIQGWLYHAESGDYEIAYDVASADLFEGKSSAAAPDSLASAPVSVIASLTPTTEVSGVATVRTA